MTRLLAPPASFFPGSLLFPVELPGVDDCEQQSSKCTGRAGRAGRGRAAAHADVDVQLAQAQLPQASTMRLLHDVRSLKRTCDASDAPTLAARLREMGYEASLASSNASHSAPSALRLAHDFVVVTGCDASAPLLVEPAFREHFAIGSVYATERYKQLLAAVPEELVAPYSQLAEMVRLICAEMKFSFEATGNSLPPWRSTTSIISRWAPARSA